MARRLPHASHGLPALAAIMMAVVAGWIAYSGALAYFFSQDDFVGLARAQGLVPDLSTPWRYLSRQVTFDLMYVLAGLHAVPYHLVSLVGHAATAALVAAVLARRSGWPAAALGAAFFAAHPASFTALYWIAAHGEIYALLFALAALIASETRGRARWLAIPCFIVSLLFKESTLLLPVVVWARGGLRDDGSSARRPRVDRVLVALTATSIVYLAIFFLTNAFGVRAGLERHAPYAIDLGSLPLNLLTYLGWTANFLLPTMRSFTDAVDPGARPYGVAITVAWVAGLAVPELRRRGWLAGGIAFFAFLAPVLPLRNHTFHYYLYAPLFGAAGWVAALAGWVSARAALGPATGWIGSLTLSALLTINGAAVVRKIEHAPFIYPELRSDATVDRARIATNVQRSLAASTLPTGVRLVFWSPAAIERQRASGGDTARESYIEQNVRAALQDGLAVRVMFPGVRAVAFTRSFGPLDTTSRYAVYRPDGTLRVGTYEALRDAIAKMEQR